MCGIIYRVKQFSESVSLIIWKGETQMKMFYEDPTVEVMLLDVVDVITASIDDLPGIDEYGGRGGANLFE